MTRAEEMRALAERAWSAGTARFRFADHMPDLGAEPIDEYDGVVDLRAHSYLAHDRCAVDGVQYAREEGGSWTKVDLGRTEPIGPVWLLSLLGGIRSTRSGPAGESSQGGERIELIADLAQASRWAGRSLNSIGGAS